MKDSPDILAQIVHGLETIESDARTIELSLKDALYISQTLGELIRFFHQRDHYPTLEAVKQFLGNRNSGAYSAIHRCYYDLLNDCWPEDINIMFSEGHFDNPSRPFYFEA